MIKLNSQNLWYMMTVVFGVLSVIGTTIFVVCFNLKIYRRNKRVERKAYDILRSNKRYEIGAKELLNGNKYDLIIQNSMTSRAIS
jgi:hypothetical protein